MAFKVGDEVSWSSSAGGSTKTKIGTVVAVIPGGKSAREIQASQVRVRTEINKRGNTHLSGFGYGGGRDHESYLVSVPQGKTGKAKPKLYWPVVSLLQAVNPGKAKPIKAGKTVSKVPSKPAKKALKKPAKRSPSTPPPLI